MSSAVSAQPVSAGRRPTSIDVGERLVSAPLALAWLVRARWHTAGLAALALLLAQATGALAAPAWSWLGLLPVVLSNATLVARVRTGRGLGRTALGVVLLADTAWLTLELGLAGGTQSPLLPGYVVLATVAALVLDRVWVGALVVAAALGCAALAVGPVLPLLQSPPGSVPAVSMFVLAVNAALVARVVAALRARQQLLAASQREAAQTEKLASLATLAGGAAHELNTPLGSIAIAAAELELLIEREPVAALGEVRVIRREVERCKRLLQQLGARAGGTLGEVPQSAHPSQLFERVRAELGASAARLDVAVDGAPPIVAPLQGLAVVLANLVSNGLQASPPAASVALTARASEAGVRFTVRDHGAGIPAEQRARLGEPFFTTKEPGQGMGLGLFLAFRFCAAHGARLQIESEPGRGTEASLDWPAPRGGA